MSQPVSLSPVRGIVCMTVGTMVLTTHDAISKWLLDAMHTGEIIAWRGVLALLTSALVILSFRVLPLADALAIIFASPVMVTALSAVLLKEPVGWRRWTATFAGFGGALLIVGPSFDTIGWWALAPLGAALASAFRDIVTRTLGSRDPGPSILFWTMIVSMAGGFASLPVAGASVPGTESWILLAATAVLIALAYRLNIAAFKLASGAIVAPLRYLSLVWAAVLGYLLWDDVPGPGTIVGAIIVMAAGLYIWRREARLS